MKTILTLITTLMLISTSAFALPACPAKASDCTNGHVCTINDKVHTCGNCEGGAAFYTGAISAVKALASCDTQFTKGKAIPVKGTTRKAMKK